jgi:hypothetical protein
MSAALLSAAVLSAGCATYGETGGWRFKAPIEQQVGPLGLIRRRARAMIVIQPQERSFKSYAPIPVGAWDFEWGKYIETVSRSVFSQAFDEVFIVQVPDKRADYQVRLAFDRARTTAAMGHGEVSSTLAMSVQLYQGEKLLLDGIYQADKTIRSTTDGPVLLGRQLVEVLSDAARAVNADTRDAVPGEQEAQWQGK